MRIPHGKTVGAAVVIAEIGLAAGMQRWPDNEVLEAIFWLCSFALLVLVVLWLVDASRFIARNYRIVSPIQRRAEVAHAAPVTASQPQPMARTMSKPIYTAQERAERYDAWSRIYRVLNEQCSAALDKGAYVSNTWKESISASPKAYAESMAEFQVLTSTSLNQIRTIFTDYEYLTDIKGYFESSWGTAQHPMYEALNVLRETLKRFPENPPRQMVELLDPQAQAFRHGVKGFGKWLSEAKKHVAQKINELS